MTYTPTTPPPTPPVSAPIQPPTTVDNNRPRLFNGATKHGYMGIRQLRHHREIPLVVVGTVFAALLYGLWIAALVLYALGMLPEESYTEAYELLGAGAEFTQAILALPVLPLLIWIGRAILYANQRATAVQMSPTQFPEGYRMVVEAAQSFGMRRVPDAYVVVGQGQINAFASGHGFRRYVVVHSDIFEIGGKARDPEALRFVIAHEVGHLAAGHTSFGRTLLISILSSVPLLGPALSRAQEYTADNHGYSQAPQGAAGAMGLLGAGKYLGAQVNMHALADRATRERGFWLHLVVWGSSHPVLTWRAHALRDRSRHGRLMIRPPESTAWFPPVHPTGYTRSTVWPTSAQVLARMDTHKPRVQAEEQFGRYPGVEYSVPRDVIRLADPTLVPAVPQGVAAPAGQSGPPTQQVPQSPMTADPYPGTYSSPDTGSTSQAQAGQTPAPTTSPASPPASPPTSSSAPGAPSTGF